jgi:hypothetical protein
LTDQREALALGVTKSEPNGSAQGQNPCGILIFPRFDLTEAEPEAIETVQFRVIRRAVENCRGSHKKSGFAFNEG